MTRSPSHRSTPHPPGQRPAGVRRSPTLSNRTRLTVLFLTVLVDLIGFGIVLPLLPFYGERFGASGTEIGLLVLVYSVVQLFMAPFWGRLSDRYGRRPILLLGLIGSAVAYALFAYARTLSVLFLSRILAGVGGSTIPVAEAYIADVTPPERRAGNMGLIGAAFGLGFTVGPALGGVLAAGGNLETPGLVAAFLCATNALLAFFLLPESKPVSVRVDLARRAGASGFRFIRRLARDQRVLAVLAVYFFFSVAWAVLQPTFSLFSAERFGLDERGVGYLFAFLGLTSAVVQGALVRRLVPWLGEATLVRISGVPFVLGLLLIGASTSVGMLLTGLALLAVGYGGAIPAALGLLSRGVGADVQGGTLGIGQSVGSTARIVGPFIAGVAFDLIGISSPYFIAAGVAAGAALLALALSVPTTRPSTVKGAA